MKSIAFPKATSSALLHETNFNVEDLSSISSDGRFGWVAHGSHFEVFSTLTGHRMASWTFGSQTGSKHSTAITSVCECKGTPFLVVATITDDPYVPGALLCLFNARISQVVKVLAVPYEVTALEYVQSFQVNSNETIRGLHDDLKKFDGIVAMGTYSGRVYLLDLKKNQICETSENNQGSIIIKDEFRGVLQNHQHLAVKLCLEENLSAEGGSAELFVTGLKFIPQASLVVVGLSSGNLEMWDLTSLDIKFCSSTCERKSGLLMNQFLFQEPENDPKNVSYLWVFSTPTLNNPTGIGQAFLLQMVFKNRIWVEDVGHVYEGFMDAYLRFSHPISSDLNLRCVAPCKILSCSTLSSGSNVFNQQSDENPGTDMDLMSLVWEESTDSDESPHLFLLIFDINQWYYSQMPYSLDLYSRENIGNTLYLKIYPLQELQTLFPGQNIMHVKVEPKVATHHTDCNSLLPVLDYDLIGVTSSGLIFMNLLSKVSWFLTKLQENTCDVFNKSASYVELCYKLNLISADDTCHSTESNKQFALLSVALDKGFQGVIISLIRQATTASLSGSETCITLETILEWSNHKLTSLKKLFDKLIHPLFEFGPAQFDNQSSRSIQQCRVSISHLVAILVQLNSSSNLLPKSEREQLYSRISLALLVEKFINITHWFVKADLIPYCGGLLSGGRVSYQLTEAYNVKRIHSGSRHLMIDFIISEECSNVQKHFTKTSDTSYYPPSNIETVLSLYLHPNISIQVKHFVSLYFLKDLLADTSEKSRKELLATFCSQLNISQSLSTLVHASWLLDHHHFMDSCRMFHSIVKKEYLGSGFYSNVVKNLLHWKQNKSALQLYKKLLFPIKNSGDFDLCLEVLASNGKIHEAYECMKSYNFDASVCFPDVINRCARGEFLKEILKTPVLPGDKKCYTFHETLKTLSVNSLTLETSNDLTGLKNRSKLTKSSYKGLPAKEKKKTFLFPSLQPLFNGIEMTSRATNGTNGRKLCNELKKNETQNILKPVNLLDVEYMDRSLYSGSEESKLEYNQLEKLYLRPRTFDECDMALLDVPRSVKTPSPVERVSSRQSILSKPKTSNQRNDSGDSTTSQHSKQLRFAEPERNDNFSIDKTFSSSRMEAEESCSVNSNDTLTTSVILEECLDETMEQQSMEFTTPTFILESTPDPKSDEISDCDHHSIVTDEASVISYISDIESIQTIEESEDCTNSLKRPPLKRVRKYSGGGIITGQTTSTPLRRSVRLSSLSSSYSSRLEQSVQDTEATLPNMEETIQTITDPEDGLQTLDVPLQREVAQTNSVQDNKVQENLPKTPTKRARNLLVDTEIINVKKTATPRSSKRETKNEAGDNDIPEKKRRDSLSRKKSKDQDMKVKKGQVENEKERVEIQIIKGDEGPLTPAQRLIRKKRMQKEQESTLKENNKHNSTSTNKPPSLNANNSSPNSSQSFQFSNPIVKDLQIGASKTDSPSKPQYVFSPPLTRSRRRRQEDKSKQVEV